MQPQVQYTVCRSTQRRTSVSGLYVCKAHKAGTTPALLRKRQEVHATRRIACRHRNSSDSVRDPCVHSACIRECEQHKYLCRGLVRPQPNALAHEATESRNSNA